MLTLYQIDANGKVREWSITYDKNQIQISYGHQGGSKQIKTEGIRRGLAGRTVEEQVKSRYYSRINKQYDRGYKDSIEEATALKGTNALNFFKPMLAQPFKKAKNIDYSSAFLQHKYDGHRCLITRVGGNTIAYSRQGKLITSIDHILDEIDLPDGHTIDGELYAHGTSLQTIGSWIKREQDATKNLMYHAYDMVSEQPFAERLQQLGRAIYFCKSSLVVPTTPVLDRFEVGLFFSSSKNAGYEGAILRWGDTGYEIGKRSKHLVKIKSVIDDVHQVMDIESSRDGWAILILITKEGKLFKVNAPGSYADKKEVLDNKQKYLGSRVKIEYANLTEDKIPSHAVAVSWLRDITI